MSLRWAAARGLLHLCRRPPAIASIDSYAVSIRIRTLLPRAFSADCCLPCRSWREYLGASVTDVDADIANFMTSFGEDLANLEANDAAIASKGSPACSRFWKRRTLAGAFLTLMVLYIVVIGGVFVWLHQGGPTFAPANSTKGGGY